MLIPGGDCWRVERAQRLAFLIDAAAYFAALRSAIARAKRTVFIVSFSIVNAVAGATIWAGRGPQCGSCEFPIEINQLRR